jgi:hypothetical protein
LDGYGPTGKEVIQIGTDRKEFRDCGYESRDGVDSHIFFNGIS